MGKKQFLIVDDDASITSVFEFVFAQENIDTLLANTKEQTIAILNSDEHIDLVFLDVKMPDVYGLELFKEIQRIRPETLIILMTGYTIDNLIREAFNLGAYGIIYKPFDVDEVITLVKQVEKATTLV